MDLQNQLDDSGRSESRPPVQSPSTSASNNDADRYDSDGRHSNEDITISSTNSDITTTTTSTSTTNTTTTTTTTTTPAHFNDQNGTIMSMIMSSLNNSQNNNHNISTASVHKRLCWVCFGTEQDDEDPDVAWVCPCQCKGTMKWVHEECLQRWVDEKQKRTNSMRVTCSQCKTHYILSFPPVNRFVKLIEQYDKLLYGSSPFVAVSVVLGSIYLCCCSYGFISIIQVMGHDDGRRLIDEADPLLLIIGLPVIPVGLILAKLIKWEDFILKVWRKSAFSLPRPLSYIFEKPPLKPRANCDQILLDPGFNEPLGCTRMICGALLLPTVSTLVGKVFFSHIGGSQWRRSLVGGLAFLLIKGALKIYLRKSQYIRYSQRSIKDYVPPPAGSSSGLPGASSGQRPGALDTFGEGPIDAYQAGDESLDISSLQAHNTNLLTSTSSDNLMEESSDDEEHQPRTRTMFSMTISLGR